MVGIHRLVEVELPRLSFSRLGVCFPAQSSPATVTACHQQRVGRARAVSGTKTCCLPASAANNFKKKPGQIGSLKPWLSCGQHRTSLRMFRFRAFVDFQVCGCADAGERTGCSRLLFPFHRVTSLSNLDI